MSTLVFENKKVLVTGASRGLGLGFVKALAQRGVQTIYAGCRTQEGIEEIKALGLESVTPLLLDVTNSAHIENLKADIQELDVLINNAGIASACGFTSEEVLETARAEMEVHYFGSLALTKAFLPLIQASGNGGIINISSIAALSNFKAMGTYSASKAALHFMTQGLRAELQESNVFVQGVYPGPFDTRLAAGFDGPKKSPETIANIVLDSCADGITEVYPDDFSQGMYQTFIESPQKLAEVFSQ
ncbi:SDR family NAD(P)-dependent oxidoreductase [Teredinibacter sp. KSP-S5-2]|uniref:SDR family NAD(P)-dependent oxidoreductase n=1 Tax=Teredinibacter sp. KSP-S5-2 TaxID=3034506 RepID=UPI00293422CB|nr:SDR family NAD(P)-dependent oxidoreductase [Teredinibacter sp. KSP-S5-2]WNO10691.1 SDR family NAD(P)-dependent oxidoreductase [Teredinibacter sp. KSP-S5-2]